VGATLITELIKRWPVIVWAGAALLGWIAGEMIAGDPALIAYGVPNKEASAVIGALLVVAVGWWLKRQAVRQVQIGS
jgi:predicted tellurium resistance membrane protein TerC